MHEAYEVAVLGGGLAGSTAAIHLAQGGVRVVLIEKSSQPHDKVCGEFLSQEGYDELRACGFDLDDAGAVRLHTARVAGPGSLAEAQLPFSAWSYSRRALDEALLTLAEEAGADVRRGVRITAIEEEAGAFTVSTAKRQAIKAHKIVNALGKHDLAGMTRHGLHNDLVGLKLYKELSSTAQVSLGDAVEVISIPGGYLGIQPSEDGRANLCLVVRERVLKERGSAKAVFADLQTRVPRTAELLSGLDLSEQPMGITKIPYGFVRERSDSTYAVGDQAAVIPSFCGEGMSMALRSARWSAEAILQGVSADAFQAAYASAVKPRVQTAARLSQLASTSFGGWLVPQVTRLAPPVIAWTAAQTRTPQAIKWAR